MQYIIGIDAGGTKTEAVAYNKDGTEISRGLAAFGNPVIHQEKAFENIIRSIQSCLSNLQADRCVGIVSGVAGIEANNNRLALYHNLNRLFHVPITVLNDAELSYFSLLKADDGILTIAGTGSVSIGYHNEKMYMCGGWGHLLGDEGSAYDIAIQAIKSAIVDFEMGLPIHSLTADLLNKMNISHVPEIKSFVYKEQKSMIASLSEVVGYHADKDDLRAANILKQAGNSLALQTITLLKRLSLANTI